MTNYTTQRMPHAEISGCALVQDLLPLYLDGEVTHESHVLISDHLSRCDRCSGYLAGAQSVRGQMLKEQQALRTAQVSTPSVTHVQQPVVNSFGRGLWICLMVLSWLGGLIGIMAGILEPEPPATVLGLTLFTLAVGGLFAVGQQRRLFWNILMILTGLLGSFFIFILVVDPYEFMGRGGIALLTGLTLLAIATWGLRGIRLPAQPAPGFGQPTPTSKPSQDTQASPRSSNGAIFTAGLSLLTAAGLLCLALLGLVFVAADSRAPGMQFTGVLFMLTGIAGFLELNQRRNWLTEWAAPKMKRRLQAAILFGSGIMWTLLVLQGWGIGSVAFLLTLGIGAGLTVAGLWRYQRNK